MYTLYKFGNINLPNFNTEYDAAPVPAQLAFIQTTTGVFDGNGNGRNKQQFPFSIAYKATVTQDTLSANRTTLDALRAASGTRANLYRKADDDGAIHRCTARLVGMDYSRPYGNRNAIHEINLSFQQLSPWVGTLNGTGWTFDSGINFDAGRNFDEVGYSATLSLATTTFTATNNGNLPTTAVSIEVTAGSEALTNLDIWNMTTNCRLYWYGTLAPGALLRIDTGAWFVTNAGVDEFNNFSLVDPYHRNEYWMEIAVGSNNIAVARIGGNVNSKIAFVFNDRWA